MARRLLAGTGKRRRLQLFAVSVVVLAILIVVGTAVSRTKDVPQQVPPASAPVDDVARAQQLVESGDTTAAIVLLQRVVASDPNNDGARSLLRRVQRVTPAPSSSPTVTLPADTYSKPTTNLAGFLPAKVEGYAAGEVSVAKSDVVQPFAATDPDVVIRARRALFQVHDRLNPGGATKFVNKVSKVAFPQDAATVKVGGVDGYFGTDGRGSAVVSFARGRYAFEVILASAGDPPASLKDLALKAARSFPASN